MTARQYVLEHFQILQLDKIHIYLSNNFKMINRLKENISIVARISYKKYEEISPIVRIENNYTLV